MDELLKTFIAYNSRIDRRFRKDKLLGSNQSDIDKLENCLGYQLPLIYKQFQLKMGNALDSLRFSFRGDLIMDLGWITDLNDEIIRFGSGFEPFSFVFGTFRENEIDLGLYYQSVEDNPQVVLIDDGELGGMVSESFSNFLFQQSFLILSSLYKYETVYILEDHETGDLFDRLYHIGYDRQWFSDSVNYMGLKTDTSSMITKEFNGAFPTLSIYHNSCSEIERIEKEIDKFHVKQRAHGKQRFDFMSPGEISFP